MQKTLSVIGLGKLGLGMAACLADKGHYVIGVDIDKKVIDAVNAGESPLYEPVLSDLIERSRGRLIATDDYEKAVKQSSVIFIFVGTPSEQDGGFSTRYIAPVAAEIGKHLKQTADFKVIALRSTILPGTTERVVKPILEETSGKLCGRDFGLCYNPEILALGSVIRDFLNPDVVTIGESDKVSGDMLADIYTATCENNPPIVRTSLTNAEIAKISLNVFLTVKMSFANTIAEICEKVPGGDVDKVSEILGCDRRIGRKFLTGATRYGGPCFPRDTKAFIAFTRQIGCQALLANAADQVNDLQNGRIIETIIQKVGPLKGKQVALLGLTYKPDTDIVLESAALGVTQIFVQEGALLKVFDPAGIENTRQVLPGNSIEYTESIEQCLRDTELCIVLTPWKEFKQLTPQDFIREMKTPVILDCWRLYNNKDFRDGVDYIALGVEGSRPC
ncbi:MAG: UDP-glucose/GDP-mannose dehydrogenase family protein [Acidobacteria bacterium]|nr:UDP-glucose/GDP-mannose dehydrogenase family protein [Acidobacteriota bacterium]